jgi:prepilin-type processing-associated H-X9-DG protein
LLFEVQGQSFNPTGPEGSDESPAGCMDGGYWGGQLGNSTGQYATGSDPIKPINVIAGGPVHTGAANYLASDGHVKWLMSSRISGGDNAANINNAEQAPAGGNPTNASGTGCLDNTAADDGSLTCNHPGTAVLTFSDL